MQTFEEDEIGNQIPVETERPILCDELSVTRNEFYNAAATGLKPVAVFKIHRFEYNGETIVRYEDGIRYNVIRMYSTNTEEIELTCEKDVGNG
ncbi:hypothetical protein D3C75_1243690 [compost metagenome]